MSFYFGVLMRNLVAIATDRTRVEYPGPVVTSNGPRYYRPFQSQIQNQDFVIVPAGFLFVSLKIAEIMYALGNDNGTFKIENVLLKKEQFQNRASSFFAEMKAKHGGKGELSFNSDTLFAGIGFLGSVSSRKNFQLQVLNKPGYIVLNQPPEILSRVTKSIKLYLDTAFNLPIEVQKSLAKKTFPQIMGYVHEKGHMVSPSGDLIFIGPEVVEAFEYGKESEQPRKRVTDET